MERRRTGGRTTGAALQVGAVLALLLGACGSSGSMPTPGSTAPLAVGTVRPDGFESVEVIIRRADGSVCRLCTYLASTPPQWQRGLMYATDLDGRDGMLFRFPDPNANRFFMRDTVMPLTGVWFGADGALIDAIDMDPCPDDEPNCPLYGPDRLARSVLEVPQVALARLRVGPGARLESIGGPCTGQPLR